MIGSIGWMEITVIAILALLVVGPKGLPKLGKSLGKALRDFKREANELKSAVELEVEEDDRREEQERKKKESSNTSKSSEKKPGPKVTKKKKG